MRRLLASRFLLPLAGAVIAGYALYASLYWPFKTGLFPRVIALPLLALSLVELLLYITGREVERGGHAVDFELTKDIAPALARKRTATIFAWIFGFLLLILLAGFPLAVPLFVLLYLKVAGKERWLLTLLLTLLSWVTIEGLFNRLLHLPFPQGWLFSLFG
jgi:hypothetical protein